MDFHSRPDRGRGLRRGRCVTPHLNPVVDLDQWARSTDGPTSDGPPTDGPASGDTVSTGSATDGPPTDDQDAVADLARRLLRTLDDAAAPRATRRRSANRSHTSS